MTRQSEDIADILNEVKEDYEQNPQRYDKKTSDFIEGLVSQFEKKEWISDGQEEWLIEIQNQIGVNTNGSY